MIRDILKGSVYVSKRRPFEPARIFRPGDVWVSNNDMTRAAACFRPTAFPEDNLPGSTILLSHVITTLVLSSRVAFFGSKKYDGLVPGEHVKKEVVRHFRTIRLDQYHDVVQQVNLDNHRDYCPILGEDLVKALCEVQRTIQPNATEDNLVGILGDTILAYRVPLRYCPNPFLANVLAAASETHSGVLEHARTTGASTILLNATSDLRSEVCTRYNVLRQHDIYDINIPSIFSAVLRESAQPGDVFVVARQFRDEARPFVKWCEELDKSQDPLRFLDGIDEAIELLSQLAKRIDSRREERLRISLVPGFAQVQVPFKASAKAEKLYRQMETDRHTRKHLAFLLNLYASARRIRSLRNELKRVFGYSDSLCNRLMQQFDRIANG